MISIVALSLLESAIAIPAAHADALKGPQQFAWSGIYGIQRNAKIDYDAARSASYYVYVPPDYNGSKPFGLLTYIPPNPNQTEIPPGWSNVLNKHHVIMIVPQNAGNTTNQALRLGMGAGGALAAMRQYKIDPSRVYAGGLSGGARTACDLAFYQPDLFRGTIQNCGANYYRDVKHDRPGNWIDTNGNSYGRNSPDPSTVAAAKAGVKFVLITGPGDFRHGVISDIYYNGFNADGFKCRLIDNPAMGHQECPADTLDQAFSFLAP